MRITKYLSSQEKIREGGGLALGCLKSLTPVWVRDGEEQVEAISIEVFIKKLKIRCCAAYGPQENDRVEKNLNFGNIYKMK